MSEKAADHLLHYGIDLIHRSPWEGTAQPILECLGVDGRPCRDGDIADDCDGWEWDTQEDDDCPVAGSWHWDGNHYHPDGSATCTLHDWLDNDGARWTTDPAPSWVETTDDARVTGPVPIWVDWDHDGPVFHLTSQPRST